MRWRRRLSAFWPCARCAACRSLFPERPERRVRSPASVSTSLKSIRRLDRSAGGAERRDLVSARTSCVLKEGPSTTLRFARGDGSYGSLLLVARPGGLSRLLATYLSTSTASLSSESW